MTQSVLRVERTVNHRPNAFFPSQPIHPGVQIKLRTASLAHTRQRTFFLHASADVGHRQEVAGKIKEHGLNEEASEKSASGCSDCLTLAGSSSRGGGIEIREGTAALLSTSSGTYLRTYKNQTRGREQNRRTCQETR